MPSEPIDAAMTLPLYDPAPPDPDGWHAVRSPGGYEWWYFDAEDAGGVQVVAIFFEGFVFHPGYLRRYARYRSRPTRHAPPTPSEYPCVYLAVYEKGSVLAQSMTQVRPDEFRASPDRPDVAVGENSLRRLPGGAIDLHLNGEPWELTWRGPRRQTPVQLSADLTFTPLLNVPSSINRERTFLSREMTGAVHRWVIANPLCKVEGRLRLGTPGAAGSLSHDAGTLRTIPFVGLGYHDHNYGTAPIGPGLRHWAWGRMLWQDRMLTFHYAIPRDGGLPDEVHVVEADADGFRGEGCWEAEANWSRRTALGLRYPQTMRFTAAGAASRAEIKLTNPRVIDASPFYLRLVYDGAYESAGQRRTAQAFCEVAYPHRLTRPLLGRMIEMSIQKPADPQRA